jgi:phosphotransferase system enzyme I (PtsI)
MLMKESTEHAPAELAAFIDMHTMFLEDPELSEKPREIIRERRCNAEWALVQQMEHLVDQFEQFDDAYLRERKFDVVQVVERVVKELLGPRRSRSRRQGVQGRDADRRRPRPVAGRHHRLQGSALRFLRHRRRRRHLAHGDSRAQHGDSGRARPAQRAAADPRQGELLIVDGTRGVVIVNPDQRVLEEYQLRKARSSSSAPSSSA